MKTKQTNKFNKLDGKFKGFILSHTLNCILKWVIHPLGHTLKSYRLFLGEDCIWDGWADLSRSQVCVSDYACVGAFACTCVCVTMHISVLWHMGWIPQQGHWAGVIQSLCLWALAGCHATLPPTERGTSKKVWGLFPLSGATESSAC